MAKVLNNGLLRRKEAQTIEATAAKAHGTGDLDGFISCVAPLNPDVKAREALQMVGHSVTVC